MLPLLLLACTSPSKDTADTASDTGDTSTTPDSTDSTDTSGTPDTSNPTDTSDSTDTSESPPLPALLTITGAYASRPFSFTCTESSSPDELYRSLSDALGNYAGTVSCGLADAPHDRFELILPAAAPGTWTDTSQPNQFQYTSDDGSLAYSTKGAVPTSWELSITAFTWQDTRTVQLVGTASGSWTTTEGAALGWVDASFDVTLECANCP